ncbi:M20/M25/M40 family metallo-hydrolase [Agilicoccus flavus]|uniref:M20/M25/M40 family metallo-hydrolase n=1 Tax=Agilicoccus flavus TaxID=2775968 RepID=UPI001CF6438C|nr:M20/M25/M40 family metallo-hydrolase [Agilicoccus flavus]
MTDRQGDRLADDASPGRSDRAGLTRRRFLAGSAVGAAGVAAGSGLVSGAASPSVAAPAVGAAAATAARPAPDPLELLQRMIRFDTTNTGKGGNTLEHGRMLLRLWTDAGVPAEIIPTPVANNVHVIARIKGAGRAKPLLFLGHSDVVPVERENWSVDPFAAVVRNGEIYGRGALDMKGANSASITALLRHVAQGARFDRDIIVLTDCDEEAGEYGSGWLAKQHWDKLDAGSVLTEGGWFLAQKDGTTPMLTSVTRQDKVYFNLDITAKGTATHSSKPDRSPAVVTLSRALVDLGAWRAPVRLTPVTREYFDALARATDDAALERALRLLLRARDRRTLERAAGLVEKRSGYPWLHTALLRTTHAFVIEEAGYKENVIPSEATARLNCRAVPGGQKPREFLAQVRRLLRDRDVTVTLATTPGQSEAQALAALDETWATPPASVDTDLFHAISQASVRTYPGAVFTPALFEAGTSLSPWRKKGIPGYGVYPYVIDNEQLVGMHGNDERIRVQALRTGTDFMYRVFDRFRLR